MIPNRSHTQPAPSLTAFAVDQWRAALDTHAIAAAATAAFGHSINEASVVRVLARLRDGKRAL